MAKIPSAYLRLIFLTGDLLILNLVIITSFIFFPFSEKPFDKEFTIFSMTYNFLWLILSFLFVPYKFPRVSRFGRVLKVHFSFLLTHFLTVISILFIFNIRWVPPMTLGAIFGLSIVCLFVWRLFYFYLNRIFINKKLNYRNVVIVGFGNLAWEIRKFFRLHPEFGYRFLGYFDQKRKSTDIHSIEDLEAFCETNNVHEIYCCLPYLDNIKVKHLVDYGLSNLIKVKLITDYRGFFSRGLTLQRYDRIPVLNVAAIPLDEKVNKVIKRVFDIAFSLFIIIGFLSWAGPIIALLIKIDSKGPVFFKQKRTGKDNEDFWCMKFRTMYINADSDLKQATKGDCRITSVGAFLRKTSLDEFPQFFNVLMGSMSVVGPRPHMLKHTEQYSRLISKFMARHNVKPGITGLAQSKGYRGETKNLIDMKHRVKLDRFYIYNWSFPLDLQIIIATALCLVVDNERAY